jgi:DNA polymerase-4
LIIVHGRHHSYSAESELVMQRLRAITPLVEQLSIDEAFLDVSDLPQGGEQIARQLQQRINQELRLPCSIGVATNKLVAKTATDVGKASHKDKSLPPNTILVVPPGEEARFMAPLPAQALYGIGPKSAQRLEKLGVHTIGDILKIPPRQLKYYFGKWGPELLERAQGIDDRPVETGHAVKSVSQETTFDQDIHNQKELEDTLRYLSEKVCYRLRKDEICGITVRIKLRWSDFTTLTRQLTLRQATDQDSIVYQAALELFHSVWLPRRPVRLLGVGVSNLRPVSRQLSLWDTPGEKEHRLLEALDQLRERYGKKVIRRAKDLED